MTKLNERIANVPERIFILAQLALGLLLAAGGGNNYFVPKSERIISRRKTQ